MLDAREVVELVCKRIGPDLAAVGNIGSAGGQDYQHGWSDLDLIVVLNRASAMTRLAAVAQEVQEKMRTPFGVSAVSLQEATDPVDPIVVLDPKVFQALHELGSQPGRLAFAIPGLRLYTPSLPELRAFSRLSLYRVSYELRRTRVRTSGAVHAGADQTRYVIANSFIAGKMLVQWVTGYTCVNRNEICERTGPLAAEAGRLLQENVSVIARWSAVDKSELQLARDTSFEIVELLRSVADSRLA